MDKYNNQCNVTHDTCNDTGHKGRENKSKSRRLANHITNITETRTIRKLVKWRENKILTLLIYLHSANHISRYMPSTNILNLALSALEDKGLEKRAVHYKQYGTSKN